ncbi:MAG: hypothetical protein IT257_08585 [Chitinophagaceae bacterium]|nr:hypothetical protein [Chitinophagaceae bacterium]
MKKVTLLSLAAIAFLFSCDQSSTREVKEAKENLTEAKDELKDAQADVSEAAKAKEIAEWNHFKNEADSAIATMENDLKMAEAKFDKSDKRNKQQLKMDYEKAKADVVAMKERLQRRNAEFEDDMKRFDKNVSEKNRSFEREFKHDMNEFGSAFKDLFKDNVK